MAETRRSKIPEGCVCSLQKWLARFDMLGWLRYFRNERKHCCHYSIGSNLAPILLLLSLAVHAACADETQLVDNEKIEAANSMKASEPPDAESLDVVEDSVSKLEKPLYNPFIERYLLDEVKNIRSEMQSIRAELIEKVVEKELAVADKSMSYATGAVTYFFYLIAGISTLLVLVGWNSIRDIKQRMRDFAENEVTRIAEKYETRLQNIEEEMSKKSRKIYHAQKEIDRTNELHSLWLKASLETIPQNKIAVYDQILALKPDDIEALTYKADAALLLGEATWAISLCNRALEQDENNSHAFYQRACAYAETEYNQEALRDLAMAISISEAFRDAAPKDRSFKRLWDSEEFQRLTRVGSFSEETKEI